jgi:hypothetical protein
MEPSSLRHHRFEVSAFANAWDRQPKPRSCTVAGLVRALSTFPVIAVANKLALPAWSPARFVPGRTRSADAVLDVTCLVFDHDHGDPDVALAAWFGVVAVLHTTWSHTEHAPRFRVVVPLARPVPSAQWSAAWAWAAGRAPAADPACKDASRLYFRPAIPTAHAPHFARVQGGELLDVLCLLSDEPPTPSATTARSSIVVPARLGRRAIDVRLAHDPASRERVAAELGASVLGEGERRRAEGITCPACGRASVWFYVAPDRLRRARCNHRNSCGWAGRLDELLGGAA